MPLNTTAHASPLTQDHLNQLTERLIRPVAWAMLKRWWFWAGFCSLLIGLLGASYVSVRAKVEEIVTRQIAKKFAEPHIRETFQEVAEKQASKMLGEEIQPAVERFRVDLHTEYQHVSDEISRIKLLNNLPVLGDKAILEGDRKAFEEIIRIAEAEHENTALKISAMAELHSIKFSYSEPPDWIGPSLSVTLEDGTTRKDADIPTDRLIMNLSDPDWQVRAKIVELLANREEKGVPDILLQVARTEKNLSVVSHAFVSFGYVTRQVKRPRLAGGAPIILPEGIDMFDIDKLEQWWQDHSAEVNEQLVDMK
jgi:hypothetical protein